MKMVRLSAYAPAGKAIPLQPWTGPAGSSKVEAPRFQDNRHMKVVRLSAYAPAGKAVPLQAWTDPEGSSRLRLPDFKTIGT
jgi:hypothetical protein